MVQEFVLGIIIIIIAMLLTLTNYLRTGGKKSLTSGVQVTPGDIFYASSVAYILTCSMTKLKHLKAETANA